MTGSKSPAIKLRKQVQDDYEMYFQALLDPFIQEGGEMMVPFNECEALKFEGETGIEETQPTEFRFIIETEEGQAVGSAILTEIDRLNNNAKTALAIWNPDNRGKGYGAGALKKLLKFAFEEVKLHRLSLPNGVFEFNKGAIALYKKCGFRVEGVRRQEYFHDGQWWDVVEMGIIVSDYNIWKEQK